MGKQKYQEKIKRLFKKSPVVSYNSINRVVNTRTNSKQYTKQFVRNLILKNQIKRLVKGFYTVHNDPSLAVFCFKPAYLGLQDALSIHNLWEQETVPVIVTTRKVRTGIREINGSNVLVRKIDKKYFFGIEHIRQGDFYFPVSDIEKTFIDLIYFKQSLDIEIIRDFKEKVDRKRLNSYLKYYPKRIKERILKILI